MLKQQEPKYQALVCDDGETRIVNRASNEAVPDDEPVFIFRARDVHAVAALAGYARSLPNGSHRCAVGVRILDFERFAHNHPERMKEPDTVMETRA